MVAGSFEQFRVIEQLFSPGTALSRRPHLLSYLAGSLRAPRQRSFCAP